jgi:HEAT repeat protein
MIVDQATIKSKLEEVRLSFEGFTKQLTRPDLSPERAERLQADLAMLRDEIATLEKLHQLGRLEPDRATVENAVEERLAVVRQRLEEETSSLNLEPQDLAAMSGEAKALLWALGRDNLTLAMQEMSQNVPVRDPERTERAVPNILLHALQEAPDAESRASAAYELGRLQVAEALPALVSAVEDRDPFVVDVALQALGYFSDEALSEAQISPSLIERVRSAGEGR